MSRPSRDPIRIGRRWRGTLRRLTIAGVLAVVATQAEPAFSATYVPTTTYTQSTTWGLAGSPYIINGNVTIASGATLTIEPGVIIKFGSVFAGARKILIGSGGTLNAVGTSSEPVTFTSIKDDTVGGDTGLDGPTDCGGGGSGGYIEVQSADPANVIAHAAIRCGPYAGATNAGVRVIGTGSRLTVSDLVLTKMTDSAFYVSGGALELARATISEVPTGSGVYVVGLGSASITDSTFIGASGCACRGIRVIDGTVTVERTTLHDLWHGVEITLSSSMTGAASSFFDDTIRDNSGWGIYVDAAYALPLSKLAHGQRNNVYDNGGTDPYQHQLIAGYGNLASPAVDWTNNYWGESVSWEYNNPLCDDNGYLAYAGSVPIAPLSPATVTKYTKTVRVGEENVTVYCAKNFVNVSDPANQPF